MIFTDQHKQIKEATEKFIEKEINPHIDVWEKEKLFPAHKLFKKLGDLGFLGISKPEEYGGLGLDYSYEMVFAEALGKVRCGGVPMAIGVQTNMATPALAKIGSSNLKEEFLRPTLAGDLVCSIAVSEDVAGSDVAAIRTVAQKQGDDYLINGSKMWITSATQADWFCLLANTSQGASHKNKSLFCVPAKTPGITISPKFDKLGMWSSDTAQVFFDNVRIPARYRIGEEGMGFIYQMQQFQEERLFAAATSIVQMETLVDDTIKYTRDRQAFGKAILDNQVVHFRLSELKTEIELLRSLIYRATEIYVDGHDVTMLASMAKLKAGRLLREVSDSCLQYWGGMGYMWENQPGRLLRDGRLTSIGGGADEIMLGIISKYLGILPQK